ncbi:hypothetical protein ACH429_17005 [Streptomyces pathocidini]|uniref:DUF2771 domain-containing protein n=1 Tax=Streptomyces pathocidini TaxID=1650571 RepID=A0ABW7UVN9_9ACTN|nr:hypothetical protein [Streptomyces pathocidini]
MTQHRSRTRRTAIAAGAVALGLVALSACEKPSPKATVTVGSNSVSAEATCYDKGEKLSQKALTDCIGSKSGHKLTVHDGQRVRIGVDPEVAESGWAMVVNGQGTMSEASRDTYRSFDFDEVFAPQQSATGTSGVPRTAQIAIIEVDKSGQAKGVWQYTLDRA